VKTNFYKNFIKAKKYGIPDINWKYVTKGK